MAQLPGAFNDGDILFAAPMELIRDFLENSLAFRATAPGQILVSTDAGNLAGDNTELLQIPQTGSGVLRIHTDGSITLDVLESGALASDTAQFPEDKIPVHDWALESSSMIPVSALPGASGFVLTPLYQPVALTVAGVSSVSLGNSSIDV